jgi:hypothetical protein
LISCPSFRCPPRAEIQGAMLVSIDFIGIVG